jgi:tetratricopeptide (TPR) repeat protein
LCAVGAAICAVNSKEPAVTLPAAIVLWDRVFAFSTLRDAWAARHRLYLSLGAACLVFGFLVRLVHVSGTNMSSWDYLIRRAANLNVSPWTYLLNQGPIIVKYLWLSIWPANLVLDYGFAQPVGLLDVWPSLLFVTSLLALAVLALRFSPVIGFWAMWFFLTLGPTSSVLPIAGEVGAERRMYLPLVGVIAVAVLSLDLALRRFSNARVWRPILGTVTVVVVLALAAATVARNRDYHSTLTIWQTSVDRRPHWRAHENLSVYLRDAGRIDESIAHLRLTAPHSPNSLHALGAALIERGNTAEGIEDLRTFIRTYPKDPSVNLARLELAGALEKAGESAEAATVYRALVKERPDNVIALSRLGNILAAAGNTVEALALLQRAMVIEPRSTPLRTLTVQLQISNGQFSDAERNARELIGIAPKDAEAHNLLGVALASQERLLEARDEFGKALSLNPGHAGAQANQGRVDERLRR